MRLAVLVELYVFDTLSRQPAPGNQISKRHRCASPPKTWNNIGLNPMPLSLEACTLVCFDVSVMQKN